MSKIQKTISDHMYWVIPIVIVVAIISCLFGLAIKSWESKQARDNQTLNVLKNENCKQVEVIKPSSFLGLGFPQYLYQCDSKKTYTLNQDFKNEL